ncbi:MAG: TetR/AcrR family transcriptional regulator [Ilumatobacter sp.]|jgi:AcrR family transcriptional regulator|uniref:TetR/AcrR family transcriptional regulator n=1 Tax=Ilumatobacter sp. TaxID=1967498 RepID=UPI00391D2659
MPDSYHHGDLPSALRAATAELVAERGPGGFSLREVARRAGVSHAAPAHHFGDSRGLLTSVATEGLAALADALGDATSSAGLDARSRFAACAVAYVGVARSNPGHYAVMLDETLHDPDDPHLQAEGLRAFMHLVSTVEAVRDEVNPGLDVDAAAILAWSSIHGLVELDGVMSKIAENLGAPPERPDVRLHRLIGVLFDAFVRR